MRKEKEKQIEAVKENARKKFLKYRPQTVREGFWILSIVCENEEQFFFSLAKQFVSIFRMLTDKRHFTCSAFNRLITKWGQYDRRQ